MTALLAQPSAAASLLNIRPRVIHRSAASASVRERTRGSEALSDIKIRQHAAAAAEGRFANRTLMPAD